MYNQFKGNHTKYLNWNYMFHLLSCRMQDYSKISQWLYYNSKKELRSGKHGSKAPFWEQKRNRIVKFYCAFDAVQCWCALFPPPLPAASGTISPSLCLPPPPGLGLAQTPPGNIKVHSQALIEETSWTEISFLKEQIDESFATIAPVTIFCEFFQSVIEIVRLGASK